MPYLYVFGNFIISQFKKNVKESYKFRGHGISEKHICKITEILMRFAWVENGNREEVKDYPFLHLKKIGIIGCHFTVMS